MKTYKQRTDGVLKKVEQEKAKQKKKGIIALAATAVAVTSLGLVLFIPYNTAPVQLTEYQNSEYYALMNKVNELTYAPPLYKNNFEKWFGDLTFGCGARDTMMGGAAVPENSMMQVDDVAGKYEEVTNNQTQGVIEGDLFKRTSEYIFYLNYQYGDQTQANGYSVDELDFSLQVYSIAQTDSALVGSFVVKADEGMRFNGYVDKAELYLSQDGGQVTIVSPCYDIEKRILYTVVMAFDVSDVTDISEVGRTYVSGNYVSSRMVDDQLYVVANYHIASNPDFSKEERYLPQVGGRYALNSISAENIIWSEDATSARYTVLCKVDCNTLATVDSLAFFSYSQEIYASQDNMFITRGYSKTEQNGETIKRSMMTEIACVQYSGENLSYHGSVSVEGYLNDQYSMDEYDGVLRVFTTYSYDEYVEYTYGETVGMRFVASVDSASLYCIDVQSLQVLQSVEQFAPEGETVRSARFDGTKAYVCTAILVKDPVFSFDLSDLNNITYTDTGVIDGYSISLVKFANDTLLGIGYNEQFNLKVELYQETPTAVVSLTSYEPKHYVTFSDNFKAYYIDSKNGYVGLHDGYLGEYILLQFDGYNLVEAVKVEFAGNNDRTRATIVDGWLYMIGDSSMKAVSINSRN